jgi:hypothetical protein
MCCTLPEAGMKSKKIHLKKLHKFLRMCVDLAR